jgi:hypothetical protein
MGGPRDGELAEVPPPLPDRIEWEDPPLVGVYARSRDLRFRGTMVRYEWRGFETR